MNQFPITEPEQGEASFFPWYSLAVFALVLSPLLALLQWLFPSWPCEQLREGSIIVGTRCSGQWLTAIP